MKAVELTKNEKEVLVAIVANAKHYGEDNNFVSTEVAFKLGKTPRSVAATTGSLQKKGMVHMHQGEGGYFDGELTEAGLHEVESSKVNNEQEVKQSNNSKNMATKKAKTVKVEDSKSVTNAVDNFDAPVMDERILKLNEYKAVKMANLSKGKRPAAKEAKELATYILNNWGDENALASIYLDDASAVDKEVFNEIILSRLQNFDDVKKACEKAPKAKTEKKETKKAAPAKAPKADSKKAEPKAKEEVKKETKSAKTARKVGDVHPNHPTWIWTEYAEGKFDWRTNPADKKQGQRTDKAPTSSGGVKERIKAKAAKSKENETESEKANRLARKQQFKLPLTIDEFVAMPKHSRSNSKPSKLQAEALKLITKGYRIERTVGPLNVEYHYFTNGEDRKQCNWDSVVAMLRRYGIDYIPVGLVK